MIDVLTPLVGAERAVAWSRPLGTATSRHGIAGAALAFWLANALHESGGLSHLEESFRYGPERLMAVWPARFNAQLAAEVAGDPERIAEIAYGGRMGNTSPGDGYRYRGRGVFQLTGRDNYLAYQRDSGRPVVNDPDLLLLPEVAADSAAWFWARRKLGPLAEAGDWLGVVYRINGGYNGLADREVWLARVEDALRRAETAVEPFGDAARLHLFDLTLQDALGLLWALLRGEREYSLRGDFAWRVSPIVNAPHEGAKVSVRRKQT